MFRNTRSSLTLNRGGSIVADFLAGKYFHIGKEHIYAAVRSEEQAKALSQLGINVLQLDLIDGLAVTESILRKKSEKGSIIT